MYLPCRGGLASRLHPPCSPLACNCFDCRVLAGRPSCASFLSLPLYTLGSFGYQMCGESASLQLHSQLLKLRGCLLRRHRLASALKLSCCARGSVQLSG